MDLPIKYIEKMKFLLKEDFNKYIESFNEKNYQGIRANTLKISPEDLKSILDFNIRPIPWCDTGFYYNEDVRPAKSPYYNAGLFYIQEPSAMSTGAMLPIEKGDKVLDICAAPGGKSTQIAGKLMGSGVLVSNDISTTRCKALLKNIEINGVYNGIVTNETPKNLARKFKGYFNKIIVDAPCSGEGMFRKDRESIKNWEIHKTEICCNLQREILFYARDMLDYGGIIAYSTCTFAPEENEEIVNEFLLQNKDFELIDFDKSGGFENARKEWIKSDYINSDIYKAGRLMPYNVKGEGHFLAIIRKKGQAKNEDFKKINPINKKYIENMENFFKENLNIEMYDNLELHKTSIFCIPNGIDLSGLRVVRSGFYLGEIKTNRFEPSQAFAMGLKKENVKYTISFNVNDENLNRYLKGESFFVDSKNDGWHLICIDKYPIGWGKVQRGRLKNKYLPGWRIY